MIKTFMKLLNFLINNIYWTVKLRMLKIQILWVKFNLLKIYWQLIMVEIFVKDIMLLMLINQLINNHINIKKKF
jgi:hypothetical protein